MTELLQQAVALHQAGNLPQAEVLYRRILLEEPDNPDALHLLGLLAHQTGSNDTAVELINRALELRPASANAYNNLGLALHELGKLEEAAASYRRALTLKPDFFTSCYNLGNVLKDLNRLDEAASCYRRAISLNPELTDAHYNLGLILQEQDKLTEATVSLRRALALEPDKADILNSLGIVLTRLGPLDEAVNCLRRALALKPDYAQAHNHLGIALSSMGRLDEAADSFRRALTLQPDEAETHYNLGNALKDLGRTEEAVACFRQALALKPDHAESCYNLGFISRQLGNRDEAVAHFNRALNIEPDFARAYKGLSLTIKFSEADKVVDAMERLYEKIGTPGDRIDLGFALGKIFEDLKDYDRAFAYLLEANRLKRSTYQYSINHDRAFFKSIKKIFSPGFFDSHRDAGVQDKTPVFILGMPRSGTTLVEQIIASHPQVFGAGELWTFADITTQACGGAAAGEFPECMQKLEKDALTKMGFDYMKKIRELAPKTPYITDKLPHNFLRVGLIRTILPQARVIHCVRDPMDTCYSIFKKDFEGRHDYAYDLAELGEYYNLYRDLMAHWETVLPGFMHTVHYEELVADQENRTRSLLDFCSLPWDDACLAFHRTERRIATASLDQVRRPIYRDSVQLWKRYEKQLEPLRKAIYG